MGESLSATQKELRGLLAELAEVESEAGQRNPCPEAAEDLRQTQDVQAGEQNVAVETPLLPEDAGAHRSPLSLEELLDNSVDEVDPDSVSSPTARDLADRIKKLPGKWKGALLQLLEEAEIEASSACQNSVLANQGTETSGDSEIATGDET